jgi:hypothetical protein
MEEDDPVKRLERQPLTQSATSRSPPPRGRAVGGASRFFAYRNGIDRAVRAVRPAICVPRICTVPCRTPAILRLSLVPQSNSVGRLVPSSNRHRGVNIPNETVGRDRKRSQAPDPLTTCLMKDLWTVPTRIAFHEASALAR